MAEIWNSSCALRQASCALAASKQRQVTLEEVSCSFLFGCSSKSFMERTTCSSCALCALCRQASLFAAQPHPHCFLRYRRCWCWINFKLRRAVSLTIWKSSAGICNHDWLAIGWRLQSQINAQVSIDIERKFKTQALERHVAKNPWRSPGSNLRHQIA